MNVVRVSSVERQRLVIYYRAVAFVERKSGSFSPIILKKQSADDERMREQESSWTSGDCRSRDFR